MVFKKLARSYLRITPEAAIKTQKEKKSKTIRMRGIAQADGRPRLYDRRQNFVRLGKFRENRCKDVTKSWLGKRKMRVWSLLCRYKEVDTTIIN